MLISSPTKAATVACMIGMIGVKADETLKLNIDINSYHFRLKLMPPPLTHSLNMLKTISTICLRRKNQN